MKNYLSLGIGLLLTACGGGGGESISAKPVRIFSDGSGIVKGNSEEGEIAFIITPSAQAFADVLNSSENDDEEPTQVADFPIIAKFNGYTFHEGVDDGLDTMFAVKSSDKPITFDDISHGLMVVDNGDYRAILVSTEALGKLPSGEYSYIGMFVAHDSRFPDWKDVGELDLSVNFSNEIFTINASSNETNLAGTGFFDNASGQLSSINLMLIDNSMNEERDASLLGAIGGSTGELAAGVWHTNEDTPIITGAFVAHR